MDKDGGEGGSESNFQFALPSLLLGSIILLMLTIITVIRGEGWPAIISYVTLLSYLPTL